MPKAYLITGGAGFIGSHLADALLKRGDRVDVFDNLSSGRIENLAEGVRFVGGDVRKVEALGGLSSGGYEAVFHLAAQPSVSVSVRNPGLDHAVNLWGSLNVFHTFSRLLKRPHVVFASSAAVYGPQDKLPIGEDFTCLPASPYAANKLSAEMALFDLRNRTGFSSSVLRFSNVYGPRQSTTGEAGVIALFSEAFAKRNNVKVYGDGEQTRDFVYVGDVVQALVHASDKRLNGTYNVSGSGRVSVRGLLQVLSKITGFNPEVTSLPDREGDIKHSCLDNRLLRSTGWDPAVQLEDGLTRTLAYYG